MTDQIDVLLSQGNDTKTARVQLRAGDTKLVASLLEPIEALPLQDPLLLDATPDASGEQVRELLRNFQKRHEQPEAMPPVVATEQQQHEIASSQVRTLQNAFTDCLTEVSSLLQQDKTARICPGPQERRKLPLPGVLPSKRRGALFRRTRLADYKTLGRGARYGDNAPFDTVIPPMEMHDARSRDKSAARLLPPPLCERVDAIINHYGHDVLLPMSDDLYEIATARSSRLKRRRRGLFPILHESAPKRRCYVSSMHLPSAFSPEERAAKVHPSYVRHSSRQQSVIVQHDNDTADSTNNKSFADVLYEVGAQRKSARHTISSAVTRSTSSRLHTTTQEAGQASQPEEETDNYSEAGAGAPATNAAEAASDDASTFTADADPDESTDEEDLEEDEEDLELVSDGEGGVSLA